METIVTGSDFDKMLEDLYKKHNFIEPQKINRFPKQTPEILDIPNRLDLRFFKDGVANKQLLAIIKTAEETFYQFAKPQEEILGVYIIGSQAKDTWGENSDLDILIYANTGHYRGGELGILISNEINQMQPIIETAKQKLGVDIEKLSKEEATERGLLKETDKPAIITMLSNMGLIKKRNIIDVGVFGTEPFGRSYDVRANQWVDFKNGNLEGACMLSNLFQFGF
jgi:predicted nucleotidyltransferase